MSSFLKDLLARRKRVHSTLEIDSVDEAISVLVDHLLFLMKDYDVHYELKSRLKVFNKSNKQKKRDTIAGMYLEIEDFLVLQKKNAVKNKFEFRKAVISDYPILNSNPEFGVIFSEEAVQKIILSKLFLRDILIKSKQILGNFHDKFLIEADHKLSKQLNLNKVSEGKSANELKKLIEYSVILQNKIGESLGKNAMLSIYNNAYNKHFNNYYLLDSFTVTINLVPEELLIIEDVNLPSKGQLHKLLKTQISSLGEINDKLSQEIRERGEVQQYHF